jgi:hypothetical protein
MRTSSLILTVAMGLGALSFTPGAAADDRPGPCALHQRQGEVVQHYSKRLIRCATARWEVRGGAKKAICIARHESGLDPKAASPGGKYLGLFQHSAKAWPDRFRTWTQPAWDLDPHAGNGRTNAIVTIRMVNANGWGPWAGVDGC